MSKRNVVALVMVVMLTLSGVAVAAVPAISSGAGIQSSLEGLFFSADQIEDFLIISCGPACPAPGTDGV